MDGKFSQFSHHFSSRSLNERATPLNALSHQPGPFGICSDRGGGGGPQEVEPVVYNSDSEECVEFPEEGTKPVGPIRASGSKRSRAAEVHNMSEKRRRNRINEKMKALQKLIPNSNKTDKASMLDEAIDYLKQLQLQVQMLSMRNGLNLHPMYMPGTLQSLQASQMELASSADNAGPLNIGFSMLPLSRELTISTFDLPSQDTLLHQSVIASVRSSNDEIVPRGEQPSQAQQGSFNLGMANKYVVHGNDNTAHQQADISVTRRQVTELQSTTALSSLPFEGQLPALQMADRMKLHGVIPHDELEKYQDNINESNQICLQHMHGLQRGRVYCSDGLKGERRVEF